MRVKLFIFIFTISLNFLYSEITNFSDLCFRSISTKTYGIYEEESYNFNPGIIYKNNFNYQKENFSTEINNEFFLSDSSDENRNSLLYNQIFSDISYHKKDVYLHIKDMFRYYNLNQTIRTYLPGYDNPITQNYQNFLFLGFEKNFTKFDFNSYFGLRSLNFKDNINQNKYTDYDFYSDFRLDYSISKNMILKIETLFKDDLNESNEYNFSKFGAGIKFNKFVFPKEQFEMKIFRLKSDAIPKIFKQNFVFDFRQRFNLFSDLNGFVRFLSHNVYSQKDKKVYRVANTIRVQTRYRFLEKDYLFSGMRLAIENENKIYFAEIEHLIRNSTTMNLRYQKSINLYDEYIFSVKYYFHNLNSIWIENDYIDYQNKMKKNEIFVGFTTYFTKEER